MSLTSIGENGSGGMRPANAVTDSGPRIEIDAGGRAETEYGDDPDAKKSSLGKVAPRCRAAPTAMDLPLLASESLEQQRGVPRCLQHIAAQRLREPSRNPGAFFPDILCIDVEHISRHRASAATATVHVCFIQPTRSHGISASSIKKWRSKSLRSRERG